VDYRHQGALLSKENIIYPQHILAEKIPLFYYQFLSKKSVLFGFSEQGVAKPVRTTLQGVGC
jgi:hypothetical protein